MRKICIYVTIISMLIISLAACSVQRKTDVYEFCDRFNLAIGQNVVDSTDYYLAKQSEYNYFISINSMENACITLTTDSENAVCAIQITMTKSKNNINEVETEELFRDYCKLCEVLMTADECVVENILTKHGVSSQNFIFGQFNITFDDSNHRFSVFCNEEIITAYCERLAW